MTYPKKLSIGIRIVSCSPAHVHFVFFANMIPEEQAHTQATRASLGEMQCLRNEEFKPFMERLQPDVFTLALDQDLRELRDRTGVQLLPLGSDDHWCMGTEGVDFEVL